MAPKDIDVNRLDPKQVAQHPILVVFGSDKDLVNDACLELCRKILSARPEFEKWSSISAIDPAFESSLILDFFRVESLFGTPEFLLVTDLTEKHGSYLQNLFKQSINSNALLMLSSSTVKSKSKIIQAARDCNHCRVLSCYESRFSRQDLASELNSLGISSLAPPVLDTLASDLANLHPGERRFEIARISLFARDGSISVEDLAALRRPSAASLDQAASLAELFFAERPLDLMTRYRGFKQNGGDDIAFLLIFGRAIADSIRAVEGAPGVFWKLANVVKTARLDRLAFKTKLQTLQTDLLSVERTLRQSSSLSNEKIERLLLRSEKLIAS